MPKMSKTPNKSNPPSSPKVSDLIAKFKELEKKKKNEEDALQQQKSPRSKSPETKTKQEKKQDTPTKTAMLAMAEKSGAVHAKSLGISEKLLKEIKKLKENNTQGGMKLISKMKEQSIAKAKEREEERAKEESKSTIEKGGKKKTITRTSEIGIVLKPNAAHDFPILIDDKGSAFAIDMFQPPLGAGSFGEVRVAVNIDNPNKSCVVKIYTENPDVDFSDKRLDREIRKHELNKSLVGFVQSVKSEKKENQSKSGDVKVESYLIMERAQGIGLDKYLSQAQEKAPELQENLTPETALSVLKSVNIALAVCREVKRLHDMDIIHRDIKPQNIMYNENTNDAKLIDLETLVHLTKAKHYEKGRKKKIDRDPESYSGMREFEERKELVFYAPEAKQVGTTEYLAPEIVPTTKISTAPRGQIATIKDKFEWQVEGMYQGQYSKSSDNYALGRTLQKVFDSILQLNDARIHAMGKPTSELMMKLKKEIMALCRDPSQKKPPNEQIISLMDSDPEKRASIAQAMELLGKHEKLLMAFIAKEGLNVKNVTHPKLS